MSTAGAFGAGGGGGGRVGCGAVLAFCDEASELKSRSIAVSSLPDGLAAAAAGLADDDIAAFAESVELAAVEAYTAGAPLLSKEVLPVGKLFLSHHQAHAAAFAKLGGSKATGKPNAKLVEALTPTLQGLKTSDDVLEFAFKLENQAASTYAYALTVLTTSAAYSGTATILPVETAHAAALGMALGKSMNEIFPTAFESTDISDGVDPAKYPLS